jgi:hypothetical protein
MHSLYGMISLYEIMVLGYYFKPLPENGLFMVWLNTMNFWMKSGINSWCDGMNSYICTKQLYDIYVWINEIEPSEWRTETENRKFFPALYEIMVLGYDFKTLLENGLFMIWLNNMKFWMKSGINSWCDGMNSYICTKQLNSYLKYMYELMKLN